MAAYWWRKLVSFPVKRAWVTVAAKIRAARRKVDGGGILKLHNDVETCGYEDVQVMWEMMLHRSESKGLVLTPNSSAIRINKRRFWKLLAWSNQPCSCLSMEPCVD